ncbi:MAG: XdhC family protein [Chitinophagaceae bacterium]
MKEIEDIIQSFKAAQQAGKKVALATVVHVEGSSYRRPGARMLVTEDGQLTGAISGGCLEGDALRKALFAISQQQNKLVTYNTMDEDDMQFGVQLGCNGIVHILFEPIAPEQSMHPVALLEKALKERRDAVVVTLFSLDNYSGNQPGTCFLYNGNVFEGDLQQQELLTVIKQDAVAVLETGTSLIKQYQPGKDTLTGFVELLKPPVTLVIAGAGNDALPLVAMASVLGWHITIADGRPSHATAQRFPQARKILVGKPADFVPGLLIDQQTVFVLMSHNYNYDKTMLQCLLQHKCGYIGVLGPLRKMERMLNELEEEGFVISEEARNTIFGPTGLDIGAETAEEIALSVIAEIKKVLSGKSGISLRDKNGFIHDKEIRTKK